LRPQQKAAGKVKASHAAVESFDGHGVFYKLEERVRTYSWRHQDE